MGIDHFAQIVTITNSEPDGQWSPLLVTIAHSHGAVTNDGCVAIDGATMVVCHQFWKYVQHLM